MRPIVTATLCLALCCAAGISATATTVATPAPTPTGATGAAATGTAAAPAGGHSAALDAQAHDAATLAAAGKFKEAIAKLEALRRDPACPPRALSLLGALYVKVNRPKDALAVLAPMADAPDAQPAVLYNAGLAAGVLKENTRAQNYFTRAVVQQKDSPASRELGLLLAHQGKVVEGYSLLRPWSLRNPADGEARLTAAALALQLDRPADAEQLIEGMNPTDPAIQLVRGKILVQKGDGAGAVALLAPLMARHPAGMEPEVRRTLAEAYVLAGQPAPAVDLLKGRVANHPTVALVLARAQHKAGDLLGAMVTLRPFADQLPADAKGLGDPRPAGAIAVEYGRLLVDAGRSPEAIAALDKATRILPQSQEAWTALSQAYGAAGRRAESQAAAAKAEQLAKSATLPQQPAPPKPPGR
jgi:predicted Zn-dependent protease